VSGMVTRRALLKQAGSASVAAVAPAASRDRNQSPDVLLVVLDDMRAADWQALGRTRQLLANGRMFENFILNTPQCGPSRASLFTGQHTHNHGVFTNDEGAGAWQAYLDTGCPERSIYHAAQQVGYRTSLYGKFLNDGATRGDVGAGWSSYAVSGDRRYFDFVLNEDGVLHPYRGPENYITDVLANRVVADITTCAPEVPMMMVFSPKAPHGPSQPGPAHRDEFTEAVLAKSLAFNEADVSDKPEGIRERPKLTKSRVRALEKEHRRRLQTVASVDDAIVQIVEAIAQQRDVSNLYVFVLSDNGYALGDHRWIEKRLPYDGMVRVPMLAFGPEFESGTSSRLCAMVDIAPTIAAAIGVDLPLADGVPLTGRQRREDVLIDFWENGEQWSGLRGVSELYVEYLNGEREYYDHTTDPGELENALASWQGHTPSLPLSRQLALRDRVATLRTCRGETCWRPAGG